MFGVSVDLLVYYKARYWLLECKNPGPPSSQKLTEREKDLAALFPIFVVTTPAEALDRIGVDLAA
jgi:hypothetical protein